MYKADATKAPESDGLHNELQIISGKSLSLFVSLHHINPPQKGLIVHTYNQVNESNRNLPKNHIQLSPSMNPFLGRLLIS